VKTCDKLGADILRLWVASVDYQADVRISDHILTQTTEVYRKIRNTLRYLLGNFSGFDARQDAVNMEDMSQLDRYAMLRLQRMTERVLRAYEQYEFHVVYQAIHHFCSVELSAFYLDILKDRLYADGKQSLSRRSAQTVLYEVLLTVTKLIAPIVPHTADEVWRHIPQVAELSVQLSDLPVVDNKWFDEALEQKYDQFILIRDEVLKALEIARQDKVIGNSLSAEIHIYPTVQWSNTLSEFHELEKLFIVSSVHVHDHSNTESNQVEVKVATGEKCERCWNVTTDVGTITHHPTCCSRCAKVVDLEMMTNG
jgi:isoleucyl-tRNA synthetase